MSDAPLPHLSQASARLSRRIEVVDERGHQRLVQVPAERDLTIYVDRTEVVTLMTLGAHPEWLVLGYLLNQGLVASVADIESITVDWEVASAAVRSRAGIALGPKLARPRVVTTGCGQGSMFADLLERVGEVDRELPRLRQSTLTQIIDTVRGRDSLYKIAGSVHACALFEDAELRVFIEDVGRHNALDSIAGWRGLQVSLNAGVNNTCDQSGAAPCPVLYTTGRLTSEMIIKAAHMAIPVVVSRSGTTEMAIEVAEKAGVCAIGRALNHRFLCYTHPWRLVFNAEDNNNP